MKASSPTNWDVTHCDTVGWSGGRAAKAVDLTNLGGGETADVSFRKVSTTVQHGAARCSTMQHDAASTV
eukprot:7130606-Prymnesium_polylepis.1